METIESTAKAVLGETSLIDKIDDKIDSLVDDFNSEYDSMEEFYNSLW